AANNIATESRSKLNFILFAASMVSSVGRHRSAHRQDPVPSRLDLPAPVFFSSEIFSRASWLLPLPGFLQALARWARHLELQFEQFLHCFGRARPFSSERSINSRRTTASRFF